MSAFSDFLDGFLFFVNIVKTGISDLLIADDIMVVPRFCYFYFTLDLPFETFLVSPYNVRRIYFTVCIAVVAYTMMTLSDGNRFDEFIGRAFIAIVSIDRFSQHVVGVSFEGLVSGF